MSRLGPRTISSDDTTAPATLPSTPDVLSTDQGGFGQDVSAETGYVKFTAGAASFETAASIVTAALATILAAVYPVGCIYTSIVATNPATVFGFGTWVAFGAGKVLVGLDAGQTEFDTVEETGGAKTVALALDELPAHRVKLLGAVTVTGSSALTDSNYVAATRNASGEFSFGAESAGTGTEATLGLSSSVGGDAAHENLPPYIVVYFWKRTV